MYPMEQLQDEDPLRCGIDGQWGEAGRSLRRRARRLLDPSACPAIWYGDGKPGGAVSLLCGRLFCETLRRSRDLDLVDVDRSWGRRNLFPSRLLETSALPTLPDQLARRWYLSKRIAVAGACLPEAFTRPLVVLPVACDTAVPGQLTGDRCFLPVLS
nr:hypothetical protein Iba_chr08eCG4560 [Ipomoea batatas]